MEVIEGTETVATVDGIDFIQYDNVEGLSLPVALPTEEYVPPIVVYRDWTDPEKFLAELVSEIGTAWSDEHVVEGRDARVIDISPAENPRIFSVMEKPLIEANERIGLDLSYWNHMCLNRLTTGGEHAAHSDYMPEAKLFFTLVLQDPDEGGDFFFVEVEDTYRAGDLVIFGAFLVHGVEPVERGERISLTGWMGGPPLR